MNEAEINSLINLTSGQTAVDVSDTVKKFLDYKNTGEAQEVHIDSFIEKAIDAQHKRTKAEKELDERALEKWIAKIKNGASIEELIESENKNPEIVSLKNIKDQEMFPSLKININGLIEAEKINESPEEKILKVTEASLTEFKKISTSLEGISGAFKNTKEEIGNIKTELNTLANNEKSSLIEFKGIRSSIQNMVEEEKLKKLMKKVAKSMTAIESLDHKPLVFESRKSLIEQYIKDLKKEKVDQNLQDIEDIEDPKGAKEEKKLKAIILLFTNHFSFIHLKIILDDLFTVGILESKEDKIKNIDKLLNSEGIIQNNEEIKFECEKMLPEEKVTSTERFYEVRTNPKAKSDYNVSIINDIIRERACRIFLGDDFFREDKYNQFSKPTDSFKQFMELCFERIEDMINQADSEEAFFKKILEYTNKFDYISNDASVLKNKTIENILSSSPNSFVVLDSLDALNRVLEVMESKKNLM